jgi:hypothetical protein
MVQLGVTQDEIPCAGIAIDTDTEMRELGIGRGETILEATTGAVSNALGRMKKRIQQEFPHILFKYETKSVSTEDGEQVEIETTIGQPNIVCNEVQMPSEDNYVVYLALSVYLPDSIKNKAANSEE